MKNPLDTFSLEAIPWHLFGQDIPFEHWFLFPTMISFQQESSRNKKENRYWTLACSYFTCPLPGTSQLQSSLKIKVTNKLGMGSVYVEVFFASESTPISFFKLNTYISHRDIKKIHLLRCHKIAPLVSKYPPLRSFPKIDWVANQRCHD